VRNSNWIWPNNPPGDSSERPLVDVAWQFTFVHLYTNVWEKKSRHDQRSQKHLLDQVGLSENRVTPNNKVTPWIIFPTLRAIGGEYTTDSKFLSCIAAFRSCVKDEPGLAKSLPRGPLGRKVSRDFNKHGLWNQPLAIWWDLINGNYVHIIYIYAHIHIWIPIFCDYIHIMHMHVHIHTMYIYIYICIYIM
jgi:hypothetical protein